MIVLGEIKMMINNIKQFIKNREPKILDEERFTKFAVLLPLIEKNGETHVLFEERAHHMRSQPGEICFPGGRVDPTDATEEDTAIRETCEELGLTRTDIQIIAALDYLVTPYNTIIYPFAGNILNVKHLQPNPDEVEEAFTIPLSFFLTTEPEEHKVSYSPEPEEGFPTHLLVGGENYKWRGRTMSHYFYHYNEKVIWGLTARILRHFVSLIK